MPIQKKGRTLALTVNELLESKRFDIAIRNFYNDPMFMKAILIELGEECLKVAKNTVIKQYNTHSSLNQFEMTPYLRTINDFTTFNIWWGLSQLEQKLYMADPKGTLSEEEKKQLLDRLRIEMMGS